MNNTTKKTNNKERANQVIKALKEMIPDFFDFKYKIISVTDEYAYIGVLGYKEHLLYVLTYNTQIKFLSDLKVLNQGHITSTLLAYFDNALQVLD